MIVRELLAIFGLDYDGKGQAQAEKGIAKLTSQVSALQTALSTALSAVAIAGPAVFLAKMASDAQESLNLLNVIFQDSAGDVIEWSNQVAAEVGRSKYTLRDLASEFGGLVGAMVGPGEQAAKMSMQLSRLAVDLSSLRNISEKEALRVLQSALAGETEAIKRFGVDLTVAAQEAEALRLGFGKYQTLTKEQKAQVRFNILMRDLAFVSGDAANTLDQFANSARAFRDQLKDIGTELGFFLLPAFEDLLIIARRFLKPVAEAATRFREFAKDTNLAQGALVALGLILAAVVLPPLLAMLPFLAFFAALALVIDDVITYFKGGNSVLGTFIQYLKDIDTGKIEGINPVLRFMVHWFLEGARAVRDFGKTVAKVFGQVIEGDFSFFRDKWSALVQWLKDTWQEFKIDWTPHLHAVQDFIAGVLSSVSRFLQTPLGKILFALLGAYVGRKAGAALGKGIGGTVGEFLGSRRIPGSKAVGDFLGSKLGAIGGGAAGVLAGLGAGTVTADTLSNLLSQGASAIAAPQALPSGLGSQAVVFQQGGRQYEMNIYQQPGESKEDFAQRVADIVDAKAEERDLALAHQLTQGAVP